MGFYEAAEAEAAITRRLKKRPTWAGPEGRRVAAVVGVDTLYTLFLI